MDANRQSPPPQTVSRELLGQKVADALRSRIILGHIPDGTRLVEDDLASAFGVSRGPLREAFVVLERERLVRTRPGKGTYVRALTPDSVRQLFAVRTILEVQAAELAALRVAADPTQADVLRALVERFVTAGDNGRLAEQTELDHAIHRKIWELSENEHLADVLRYLTSLSRVIVAVEAESTPGWHESTARTHRMLVESVISGNPAVAGDWARRHLAVSLEGALAILAKLRSGLANEAGPRDDAL